MLRNFAIYYLSLSRQKRLFSEYVLYLSVFQWSSCRRHKTTSPPTVWLAGSVPQMSHTNTWGMCLTLLHLLPVSLFDVCSDGEVSLELDFDKLQVTDKLKVKPQSRAP